MSGEYHGHMTLADGSHVPLTAEEATAIWESAERRAAARAETMPTEKDALNAMFEAWQRLKELGWSEAIYCPKDGSMFDAIEAGSTGIHDCCYRGEWPSGSWDLYADGDIWPSHPILYRKKDEPSPTDGNLKKE